VEFLYDVNGGVVAAVLFACVAAAHEGGYRHGRRQQHHASDGLKSQTHAIQAGMLGLLALLLGFAFSMGLQRFDSRSEAVNNEANAIGTAFLRTELLAVGDRTVMRERLRQYLHLRIDAGRVDLTHTAERRTMDARAVEFQVGLWRTAVEAAPRTPTPETTDLLLESLNAVVDAYGVRQSALKKHIPELALFVLFAVFATTACIFGISAGLHGSRPTLATLAMHVLIVFVVFIVVDLDRPRRGFITVNQSSLVDLAKIVDAETYAATPLR
jgi:hypothetical protein